MAKRFDIHKWQAEQQMKQWLREAEDFTPDLEDDELKRSKVQQMMAKEKDLANSDYLSDVEPKIEGSQRAALEELADKFSLSEILDTLEDIYAKNDELAAADYAGEFAAKFRKWIDRKDEELNENEENIPELSDEEKDNLTDMTNEFVRKLTDLRGGNYSGDKLLAALQFVILNVQDMEPMLYTDTDGDGTPDVVDNDEEELNEVNIKKVVDQSMSNDHIGKLMDVIRNNDLGKTLNTIAVIVDQTGGMPEGAAQMIADLVAEIPEGGEEEIEEQNVTGGGASFTAGNSMAHMGKSKKKRANTPSGDMAYTQKISEDLEDQMLGNDNVTAQQMTNILGVDGQIEPDVERIGAMIGSRINTEEEWIELFYMIMAQANEISQLNSSEVKVLLTQYANEI